MIELRQADLLDIVYLRNTLRDADKIEVLSSHGLNSEKALLASYLISQHAWTGVVDGIPILMYGLSEWGKNKANVWMLGSDEISKYKIEFIKLCKQEIPKLLELYPIIFNWVDARYTKSLKWLRKLGATVRDPEPFGVDGLPFHHIQFSKGE